MILLAIFFIAAGIMQSAVSDVDLTLACGEQPSELVVTIRNTGQSDTAVYLGTALANGRWYEPASLTIELTRTGRSEPEDLVYLGMRGIAGRIDPWIVTLPARAAFMLTLRSGDFVSTTQPTPSANPEALAIRLTGRPIISTSLDMPGLNLWSVWIGTTRSNRLQLSECARVR